MKCVVPQVMRMPICAAIQLIRVIIFGTVLNSYSDTISYIAVIKRNNQRFNMNRLLGLWHKANDDI